MIKRISALSLLVALLTGLSIASPFMVELKAAPPQQEAVITSPQDRDVVRGVLIIKGTATTPNFWKYEIHYAPEPNPTDQWMLVGDVHEAQVTDGRLEAWDTSPLSDGTYSLRLRVVRVDGNYDEYYVRQISVVNAQPTQTPTTTPTPEASPTPHPHRHHRAAANIYSQAYLNPWAGRSHARARNRNRAQYHRARAG
jgi:hypothetical protein